MIYATVFVACVCSAFALWALQEARGTRRALLAFAVMRDQPGRSEWTSIMVADHSERLLSHMHATQALQLLERFGLVDARAALGRDDNPIKLYKLSAPIVDEANDLKLPDGRRFKSNAATRKPS